MLKTRLLQQHHVRVSARQRVSGIASGHDSGCRSAIGAVLNDVSAVAGIGIALARVVVLFGVIVERFAQKFLVQIASKILQLSSLETICKSFSFC